MELIDLSKPGEKKKVLLAAVLGLVAILFLWWTFFGFGKSSSSIRRTTAGVTPSPTPAAGQAQATNSASDVVAGMAQFAEIVYPGSTPSVGEPNRNIFAYYEPPPSSAPVITPLPATPTPTPPVLLAAVNPANVYAKTADFTLEASGDKFTPDLHIFVDDRELPTKYIGPQQLATTVPASFIANPGTRDVVVRNQDGRVYSLPVKINVAAPPTPNFSYVGIVSTIPRVDVAYLQDRSSKDILNVQRGDVVAGRFRVTSISEKEIVLVDTTLKIKHSLTMTEGDKNPTSPLNRPTPKVDAEDDEP
ncbi:MAG TPA: hypothetical protein VLB68_14350 [Pyrinomonadaceae bacterium]|nr:hypothetical protein [Pyrinomonadaceae bacterium]